MWDLTVQNIGGIRAGSTTIDTGLNVIQASNFRGKSSFVAALRTALGATGYYADHPLTEGTTRGEVTLETETDQYNVTLERVSPDTVDQTGTPYLEDETDRISARLFASLDEDNPVRTAVRNGDDLTELLQSPLNITDIDAQITTLKDEKRETERRISEAKRAGEQLPAVQETVTSLEDDLQALRERRARLTDSETNRVRIEELSDEISVKSGDLANITDDISRIEREIDRKQQRVETKERERAELDVPDDPEDTRDVDSLHDQIDALSRRIDLVEDLYRANQNVIEADELGVITDVDRSIAADEVDCWVCGKRAGKEDIAEYVAGLQTNIADLREQKTEIEADLEAIEAQRQERRRVRQKKQQLDSEIRRLTADIDERKGELKENRNRKAALEAEITTLRAELEDAEEEYNEELTDVKTEIRRVETELENERETLESLNESYRDLEQLQAECDEIRTSLTELRNRKKTTQESIRNRFNAIIADIIDEFDPGFSSARLVLKTDDSGDVESIDLEIVRDVSNTGHRTSVDTLSEGEVELIGLVVAMAGFQAFNLASTVPCILIDGISQLAAEHLRAVAAYLDDTSDVLVTTAYPEAGEFDGHVIDPDEWDVVSDQSVTAS